MLDIMEHTRSVKIYTKSLEKKELLTLQSLKLDSQELELELLFTDADLLLSL